MGYGEGGLAILMEADFSKIRAPFITSLGRGRQFNSDDHRSISSGIVSEDAGRIDAGDSIHCLSLDSEKCGIRRFISALRIEAAIQSILKDHGKRLGHGSFLHPIDKLHARNELGLLK